MSPSLRRVVRSRAAAWLVGAALSFSGAGAAAEDEVARALEQDRARLIELIRTPRAEGAPPLADDAELRAIAERMPDAQARLRAAAAAPASLPTMAPSSLPTTGPAASPTTDPPGAPTTDPSGAPATRP